MNFTKPKTPIYLFLLLYSYLRDEIFNVEICKKLRYWVSGTYSLL